MGSNIENLSVSFNENNRNEYQESNEQNQQRLTKPSCNDDTFTEKEVKEMVTELEKLRSEVKKN